jgi:hypothetical protein
MRTIHLSNDKKRNAQVGFDSVKLDKPVVFQAPDGRPAKNVRFIKATLNQSTEALLQAHGGPDGLSQALQSGDPEVDLERVGRQLGGADRVLLSPDSQVVHCARVEEIIYNADGQERERRPPVISEANIDLEQIPLSWTGKLLPRREVLRKFVLSRKVQILHVNGLTFDFLFDIAKMLHQKDSMLLMGGGPKGNQPLVFQRGGGSYRGFLEGRVEGDKYCLMLHLSNLELKAIKAA